MADWSEFYGDEEVPEADDEHERLTEARDAWLTDAYDRIYQGWLEGAARGLNRPGVVIG